MADPLGSRITARKGAATGRRGKRVAGSCALSGREEKREEKRKRRRNEGPTPGAELIKVKRKDITRVPPYLAVETPSRMARRRRPGRESAPTTQPGVNAVPRHSASLDAKTGTGLVGSPAEGGGPRTRNGRTRVPVYSPYRSLATIASATRLSFVPIRRLRHRLLEASTTSAW